MWYQGTQNRIVPSIRWLGILSSDVESYDACREASKPMTEAEIQRAVELSDHQCMDNKPAWRDEIKKISEMGEKCEMEDLASMVRLLSISLHERWLVLW